MFPATLEVVKVMVIRICIVALTALLLLRPAYADTRNDVLQGIFRCAAIQDDRTWLDCAYGAAQPMRAKLGLPPAPEFQQRLVPPAAGAAPAQQAQPQAVPGSAPAMALQAPAAPPPGTMPRRKASFFQILAGSAPPLVVSVITSVSYDALGQFIVTLENGQAWHQVNTNTHTEKLKPGMRITITEGALASYNMQVTGGPTYKVALLKKK